MISPWEGTALEAVDLLGQGIEVGNLGRGVASPSGHP